jgi:hypothetical protein
MMFPLARFSLRLIALSSVLSQRETREKGKVVK